MERSHVSQCCMLLFLVLQAHSSYSFYNLPINGKLTNDKSYAMYYVGETLTLLCTKNENFTGKVAFRQGLRNISQEHVTKVNATYAIMEKVVTDDDFKKTKYECLDIWKEILLVESFIVYTDYAPRNATDRQLVWLDEKTLYITWAFGNVTFKNDHTDKLIKVTAEWCFDPTDESNWQQCYDGKVGNAICEAPNITDEQGLIHVRVNITNLKRNNDRVTTVFPGIRIRDYAKPSPVQKVEVVALSSKKVRLSVTISQTAALVYNVTYYTEDAGLRQEDSVISTDKTIEISGLHPHYSYTFEVRSKFEVNRGFWSDLPSSTPSLKMPEDAPSLPPVIKNGSFLIVDSSPCTLYIYYQEVPEEGQNGVITNYTAQAHLAGSSVIGSQTGSTRTVKLEGVPCSRQFQVTLNASTAVGSSPLAHLSVAPRNPDLDNMVRKLKARIRVTNSGEVTAEWTPMTWPGVYFLLYFCKEESTDTSMCETAISYVNMSTAPSGRYPLPSADAKMKFGVAAVKSDTLATNGINFTNCIYNPEAKSSIPRLMPPIAQNEKLIVNWEAQEECSSSKRVIIFNYEIKVCLKDTCKMEPGHQTYEIADLEKGVDFSVVIRTNTSSGLTDFSEPVFSVLPESSMKVGEKSGIASAVLIFVTALAILGFCICKRYWKKKAYFKSDAVPVAPPVINKRNNNRNHNEFATFADHPGEGHGRELTSSFSDSLLPATDVQQLESDDSSCPDSPLTSPSGEVGTCSRLNQTAVGSTPQARVALPRPGDTDNGAGEAANVGEAPGSVPLSTGPISEPIKLSSFLADLNPLQIPVPAGFEADAEEDDDTLAYLVERKVGDDIRVSAAEDRQVDEGYTSAASTPTPPVPFFAPRHLLVHSEPIVRFVLHDSPRIPFPKHEPDNGCQVDSDGEGAAGFSHHEKASDYSCYIPDDKDTAVTLNTSGYIDCSVDLTPSSSGSANNNTAVTPSTNGCVDHNAAMPPNTRCNVDLKTKATLSGYMEYNTAPTPNTSGYVDHNTAPTPNTSGYVDHNTAPTPNTSGYVDHNTAPTPNTSCYVDHNTAPTPNFSGYVDHNTAPTPNTSCYVDHNTAPTPNFCGYVDHNTAPTPNTSGYVDHNTAPAPNTSGYVDHNTAPAPNTSCYVDHNTAPTPNFSGYVDHNTAPTPNFSGYVDHNTAPAPNTSCYVDHNTAPTPNFCGYVDHNTAPTPNTSGYVDHNTAPAPNTSCYVDHNTAPTPNFCGYVDHNTAPTPNTSGYVDHNTAPAPNTSGYVDHNTAPAPNTSCYVDHNTAPTPNFSGYVDHNTAPTPNFSGYVDHNTAPAPNTSCYVDHNTAPTPNFCGYVDHNTAPTPNFSGYVDHNTAPTPNTSGYVDHNTAPTPNFSGYVDHNTAPTPNFCGYVDHNTAPTPNFCGYVDHNTAPTPNFSGYVDHNTAPTPNS